MLTNQSIAFIDGHAALIAESIPLIAQSITRKGQSIAHIGKEWHL